MGFPLCWCGAFDRTSMMSGIIFGSLCGIYRALQPEVINIVSPLPALWCSFGGGSGEGILVGWCVSTTICSGAVVYSTLRSCAVWVVYGWGTAVLNFF